MALEVFANWAEDSSCFEYIGCHYVDAYHFITGLKPVRMVAFGQEKFLVKHGKKTWDTIQAVIEWEDDSVLTVYAGWINSNNDTALTQQGLKLKGTLGEYYADHKDRNCFFITESNGYETFNPNFFKTYNDWDDPTRKEYVGYGYDSVRQGLADIHRIVNETAGLPEETALRKRSAMIAEFGKGRALPESILPATAVNEGASDIHIEPREKELHIRLRIDGVLFNKPAPPIESRLPTSE